MKLHVVQYRLDLLVGFHKADSEVETNMDRVSWRSALSINTLVGRKGVRIGQRERLVCGSIPNKCSANSPKLWSWDGLSSGFRWGSQNFRPSCLINWLLDAGWMTLEEAALFNQGQFLERAVSWGLSVGSTPSSQGNKFFGPEGIW